MVQQENEKAQSPLVDNGKRACIKHIRTRKRGNTAARQLRYLLGRRSVVGASSGTVGTSARLARATATTARSLIVRSRGARGLLCRARSPTITGTAARDLDLARGHLIGHRGHLRFALRTLTGRLSRLGSRRVTTTARTAGGAVLLRCGGRRLASCRSAECVIALLARKMTTATA